MTLTCFIPGPGWAGILTPLSLFCKPPLPLVIQSRYQTAFSHRQKLYIQTKLEEASCDSPIIATQKCAFTSRLNAAFSSASPRVVSLWLLRKWVIPYPRERHTRCAPPDPDPVAPRPNSGLRGHKGWELFCQLIAITGLIFKIRIYYRCICCLRYNYSLPGFSGLTIGLCRRVSASRGWKWILTNFLAQ